MSSGQLLDKMAYHQLFIRTTVCFVFVRESWYLLLVLDRTSFIPASDIQLMLNRQYHMLMDGCRLVFHHDTTWKDFSVFVMLNKIRQDERSVDIDPSIHPSVDHYCWIIWKDDDERLGFVSSCRQFASWMLQYSNSNSPIVIVKVTKRLVSIQMLMMAYSLLHLWRQSGNPYTALSSFDY